MTVSETATAPWRELLDGLRDEQAGDDALDAALEAVEATHDEAAIVDAVEALVDETGDSAHRFLLATAFHHAGRFEEAESTLRGLWADDRGAGTRLGLRHLPRVQERMRFYACDKLFSFRGKHVVEVGGKLPSAFVMAAEPASWTCVDLHADPVEDGCYRIVEADAADMGLDDESASIVFSSSAFEHIQDLRGTLAEMYRVLRPNGVVYSDFGPIWSGPDGHHLRGKARKILQGAGLWPLADWAHLTMTRGQMRRFLGEKLAAQDLKLVERWLYRRPSLNRLFYEDYVHLFHASPFNVVRVDARGGKRPDEETLRLLNRRQAGRTNFHVKAIRVVLRKQPPSAASERLSEKESETLTKAIQRHFDAEPLSSAKFSHSGSRRIFLARLPEQDVVVKVMDERKARLLSCDFVIEKLLEAGVPVPKTLAVDREEDIFDRPYVVQERARGIPLSRWISASRPERQRVETVITEMGRYLRKIHSIPTPKGYGPLNDAGEARYESWGDCLRDTWVGWSGEERDRVMEMSYLKESGKLSNEEIDQILGLFDQNGFKFEMDEGRLLHNDFTLDNVYLDPSRLRITAFIDLHNARSGDPAYEIARFYYFYRGRGYYQYLLEGYGELDAEFCLRERLYLVHVLLEKIQWLSHRQDKFPGRLERDLDTLRHTMSLIG